MLGALGFASPRNPCENANPTTMSRPQLRSATATGPAVELRLPGIADDVIDSSLLLPYRDAAVKLSIKDGRRLIK
jgi:hypothetical protein